MYFVYVNLYYIAVKISLANTELRSATPFMLICFSPEMKMKVKTFERQTKVEGEVAEREGKVKSQEEKKIVPFYSQLCYSSL